MNHKNNYIFLLSYCFSIFSFAIFIPKAPMNIYNWILSFSVLFIFEIIIAYIFNKKYIPNIITSIYLIFVLSRQIVNMCGYIRIYHGKSSGISTLIIGLMIIIMIKNIKRENIELLSYPIFTMILLMITVGLLLNINKINTINLYIPFEKGTNYIMFLDYLIPMLICIDTKIKSSKANIINFLFLKNASLLLISIFAFMCLKGNILYNLSPLQIIFQISSTNFIRNFDAIYNYLLFFGYFSSIILSFIAYKELNQTINIYRFLSILAVSLLMAKYTSNVFMIFATISISIFTIIRKAINEKI